MIPAAFDYEVATDLQHAIKLLQSAGGEGKFLAGGQSLIPLMKFRLAQPKLLVDLNRIADLAYIKENGELRIGALTRESALELSPIIRERYPIITDTAGVIADPLVRTSRRSVAISRMPIRPTIIRRRCSRFAHRSWSSVPRASA
jgi:aerobic carbon-monoxide dehydrogenase medium subunit